MDTINEALVAVMLDHTRVETEEGWIDCTCGWESNHPRHPTADEENALEDPMQPDPPDRTGHPDPTHLQVDDAWLEHIASVQREVLA